MESKHSFGVLLEGLLSAINSTDKLQVTNEFLSLHLADQAELFNSLSEEQQSKLLHLLDTPSIADLFDELPDEDTLDASELLSLPILADVLDEMDPDEAADLLGDLPSSQAEVVLAQMEDPEDIIPLLGYPDETAGGRMTTAFIGLRPQTTADQAIKFIQDVSIETDVPYYLFVLDNEKRLVGVTGLRELVIAKPEQKMEEIMDMNVIYIRGDEDQEEAARMMIKYDLSALPVVDEMLHLIGVISHDDILDVMEDEATEDVYKLASVADVDLEPESDIIEQIRGRLPWLLLNTGTALFAAWVISNFGDLYIQVAVLAFFQSVVASQGGNAASQNVAMIVRSLALGKITSSSMWRILRKQTLVGLINGTVIGILVGVGVGVWQNNPILGVVIALALVGNMIVAGVVGTMVPLVLSAVGQDPALASSVLVTAATDSLGFLIFLSLAKVFLPRILEFT